MFDTIEQIPYRQTVFAVFVLFAFGSSAIEIGSEFADGETLASMGDDLSRLALVRSSCRCSLMSTLLNDERFEISEASLTKHAVSLLSSTLNPSTSPISTVP
jgi:hypothetical protein